MLVANPAKAKEPENGFGGHHDTLPRRNDSALSSTLNNRLSSSHSKLNSELKQSSLFQQSQETLSSSRFESTFSSKPITNGKSDSAKKPELFSKTPAKTTDFQKSEFGSFSLLETPKLLTMSRSGLEEKSRFQSSSMEQLNSLSNSYSPRATYSTTIERSVNTGQNGFTKESKLGTLSNGTSTMPKSSTFNKSIERRSSLHTKLSDPETKPPPLTNGSSVSKDSSALFSRSQDVSMSTASFSSSTFKSSAQNSSFLKSSAVNSKSAGNSKSAADSAVSIPIERPAALQSYKGTAEKCKFVGDTVRHFNAGKVGTFELFAPGTRKGDVAVNIISKFITIICLKFV